ncbi:unnamed protein product [Gongylonema pulchrum]|uniref:Uncharacterized protein n=1 Tax=Gongylonema pulchrum TaxID=637853 RepID=A0A183DJ32_9BILA|nr:unnamed protein product [Gongylonema pulchrum]
MSRRSAISIKFEPRISLPDELLRETRRGLVMETSSMVDDMDAADERAFSSLLEDGSGSSDRSKLTLELAKELLMKDSVGRNADTLMKLRSETEGMWPPSDLEKTGDGSTEEQDKLAVLRVGSPESSGSSRPQLSPTSAEARTLINPFKPEQFSGNAFLVIL